MNHVTVKLTRFYVTRYDPLATDEATAVLLRAAAEHHGERWPEVMHLYEVTHFDQGARHASVLMSLYECAEVAIP